jgi:hypothetical protein
MQSIVMLTALYSPTKPPLDCSMIRAIVMMVMLSRMTEGVGFLATLGGRVALSADLTADCMLF